MTLIYIWIALALVFLMVEFVTVTFYGLALSLSAGIVALYVFFTGDTEVTIFQGLIFVISSGLFAYFLPKFLSSHAPDMPQGADRYTGEKRSVKKVAGDLKISLDGVDYPIESDDDITSGDRVEVIGHNGAGMRVKKI